MALGGGEAAGDAFSGPDGLTVDPFGRLWVATDGEPMTAAAPGERLWLPRNQLLACDPQAQGGVTMRRFLVAPPGCEVTGPVITPDGRPRSATVVTKDDGGVIGG